MIRDIVQRVSLAVDTFGRIATGIERLATEARRQRLVAAFQLQMYCSNKVTDGKDWTTCGTYYRQDLDKCPKCGGANHRRAPSEVYE